MFVQNMFEWTIYTWLILSHNKAQQSFANATHIKGKGVNGQGLKKNPDYPLPLCFILRPAKCTVYKCISYKDVTATYTPNIYSSFCKLGVNAFTGKINFKIDLKVSVMQIAFMLALVDMSINSTQKSSNLLIFKLMHELIIHCAILERLLIDRVLVW